MTTGNEPPDLSGIGVGELSRMVRDVLVRFEGLAARLESQFVRTDIFDYYKLLIDVDIKRLQAAMEKAADSVGVADKFRDIEGDINNKASKGELEALTTRVKDLEEDKKWLVRLVLGFIVAGVLAAVFAVSKAGGGG